MLKIENISFSYTKQDLILDSISFEIQEGEIYGLMGESGSGKTTLFNLISGFLKPSFGKILIKGKNVEKIHPSKREIGYVFQDYGLFPNLTVIENVEFGLKIKGISKVKRRVLVEDVLKELNLFDKIDSKISNLSGGQKQRIAIARSIITTPSILLLDEVFSAVDNNIKSQLRNVVKSLFNRVKPTTLMISHSFEDIAALCDRVIFLQENKILSIQKTNEVIENPKFLYVAQLVGLKNIVKNNLPSKLKEAHGVFADWLFIPFSSIQIQNSGNFLELTPERIDLFNSMFFQKASLFGQPVYFPTHENKLSSQLYLNLDEVQNLL